MIADLWEQERVKLLQLPTVPLEIYHLDQARLNKYSELSFESTRFPLPQCQARASVLLKVKWDVIEVLSADGTYQVLATVPRPYTEKTMPLDWQAVFQGYKRRPRSVLYSTFTAMMPSQVKTFVRVEDALMRKERVLLITRWLDTYTIEEIAQALEQQQPDDSSTTIAFEHILYALRHPEFHPEPFEEPHTPEILQGQVPALDCYDQLLGVPVL